MSSEVFPLRYSKEWHLVPKEKALADAPAAFSKFLEQFSPEEQAQFLLNFARTLGNHVTDLAHVRVLVLGDDGVTDSTLIEEFRDRAEDIERVIRTGQTYGLSPQEARSIISPEFDHI